MITFFRQREVGNLSRRMSRAVALFPKKALKRQALGSSELGKYAYFLILDSPNYHQHIKSFEHLCSRKAISANSHFYLILWSSNLFMPPILSLALINVLQHQSFREHSQGGISSEFAQLHLPLTAEAETPILWPPHAKSCLIGKDPDAGKDWGQGEKGTTEDEMARWHHRLDGHESE